MHRIMPIVSVIIPTYNRAPTLYRSIASVLCQTFSDFELIVIDDASTDHTESVIEAFSDSRLRYKRLATNLGGAEARNYGVRMASGEYIAFQDSDDEWCCTKLECIVKRLRASPAVGGIFSEFIQILNSGCRRIPHWNASSNEICHYEKLLERNVVGTPTLVVRRSCFQKVRGFDPQMPRYQDWDLALRLTAVTTLEFIKVPLVLVYVTDGSISHDRGARVEALKMLYKKHRGAIDEDRRLKSVWLHMLGDSRMMVGDFHGRRMLLAAFLMRPSSGRFFVKALLSFLPGRQTYISLGNNIRIIWSNWSKKYSS